MPPSCAVELGTEAIHKSRAWDNGALSDTWCTVEPWSACLQKAVPMESSTLSGKIVGDSYFNPISPVCLDEGTRAAKGSEVFSNKLLPTHN